MRDIYKCNLRLVPACLHCACTRNRGTVAGSRPLSASSIICKSPNLKSQISLLLSPVGMSQAITRRTLQTLKARKLREKASGAGLATTGTKSALIDRIYRHSRSAASTQLAPEGARPPPTPSRGRGGASSTPASKAADWRLTVQLMVEQSLQGMEERLLRSLQPAISGTEDASNLSLPSPNQGTHSHETVAPRPDADAAAHPSGREDAAVVTGASPQLTVRQPPVPAKVKQRILRGEFVDFDNLLPEALYPARHGASPSPSFALRLSTDPDTDGEMVIAQQKPASRRAVRDLASWLEAWNVYITILVAHYPTRAPPLLAYQRIICDASLRFPTSCWLRYDARFRACAAEDKSLRWDTKHNDLWLECFTHSPTTKPPAAVTSGGKPGVSGARRPCTYCGSLYHFPDNCSQSPFRTFRTASGTHPHSRPAPLSTDRPSLSHPPPASPPPSQPFPPHACRDFNHATCRCTACRFRHVCSRCGDHTHGERACPRHPPPPKPPY